MNTETISPLPQTITAAGITVQCWQGEGDGPPLVVLADPDSNRAAYDALGHICRVLHLKLAPDTQTRFPPLDLARAVGGCLDQLDIDQFHLLAADTGSAFALAMGIALGARVLSITLESPIVLCPDLGGSDLDITRLRGLCDSQEEFAYCSDCSDVVASHNDTLEVPLMVLIGTRSDVPSVEIGRRYKALFKNAWFLMVYGASRNIAADRPDCFANLVSDFVKRGAKFTVSDKTARLQS